MEQRFEQETTTPAPLSQGLQGRQESGAPVPLSQAQQERQAEALRMGDAMLQSMKSEATRNREAEMGELESLEIDQLLATLREEAEKRKRKRRNLIIGVTLYLSFMIGLFILLTVATGKFPGHMMGSFSSMTGMIVAITAISKKQKEATKQIAKLDDVRTVGPLAEALAFSDRDLRLLAQERLTQLLPRLKASDASLFNAEQMNLLIHALNGQNLDLSLAILNALGQVGDERALPAVQRLAEGGGQATRWYALREAAQSCLPALTALATRKRASMELLRAANGNETPSGVLLRPATGVPLEADPAQMLRATSSALTPPDND